VTIIPCDRRCVLRADRLEFHPGRHPQRQVQHQPNYRITSSSKRYSLLDSSTKASGSSTLPLPNQYDAKNIVTAKFDKRNPDQWHKGSPKVSIIPTSGFGDRRELARGTDGGGHSFLLSYTARDGRQ